jgi:hypothetical protein
VRTYVAEQFAQDPWRMWDTGLHWTPWPEFGPRSWGGWVVTVPATAFVGVGEEDLAGAMARLNESAGRRYLIEVCTQFVERIFGGRRMIRDSEVLRRVLPGVRIGGRRPHSCGRTPV